MGERVIGRLTKTARIAYFLQYGVIRYINITLIKILLKTENRFEGILDTHI
jgi:hypothetical protein